MSLKSSFIQHLQKNYPQLTTELLENYISEQLISPFQISLSEDVLSQIKQEIKSFWSLRNWTEKNKTEQFNSQNLRKPNNYSVCMSYDFHLNSSQQLELIEINTNAAFLALGLELYSFWNIQNKASNFNEQSLVQMFLNEIQLSNGCDSKEPSIAIVDENPDQQRLYLEFLIYKYMFEKKSIRSEILTIDQATEFEKFNLIYNRYTDFFLSEDKSKLIKTLYNDGKINLSPHPWEYFLLADKQRLIDWNIQTDVEKPKSLLPTYDMGLETPEKMWAERKDLFFKPKNSYGSKQAYRGASMSRKAFDSVCNSEFIGQKISSPGEITVQFNNEELKLKYDLRCYAYKDELQLIIARLYQGQTTNLRTAGGGFACVIID